MASVAATEFKARCLELMDRVAERRETFVITKRGTPVAKLVPMQRRRKEPLFGRLREMVGEVGDVLRPAVPPEAWETLREWDELKAPDTPRRRRAGRKPRNR
jgi:prevent-host-death family protein